MKPSYLTFRFLTETIAIVASAEAAIYFLLPSIAPGVDGAAGALLNTTVLALVAGPLLVWRMKAAMKRIGVGHSAYVAGKALFPVRGLVVVLGVTLALLTGTILVAMNQVAWSPDNEAALENLQGRVLTLDERLTMSARLAASTGDTRWEDRYRVAEKDLDAVFKNADTLLERLLGKGVEKTRAAVAATSEYNDALIVLENKCFKLVRAGDGAGAMDMVMSGEYDRLKGLYVQAAAQADAEIDRLVGDARTRNQQRATRVMWMGLLLALVMFGGMVWSVGRSRARAVVLAQGMTADLASAKDRAEAALRLLGESEPLNKSIIESSLDCIKVLDLDGRLEFMSPGGQALLEIPDLRPYLGSIWAEFWKADDRRAVDAAINEAKAGRVGSFTGFCATVCGTPKYWHVLITPIRDNGGTVTRLLAVSRDTTERERAEEKLRRAKDYTDNIMRSMIDMLVVVAPDGRIVSVNQATCDQLGYAGHELIGQPASLLFSEEEEEEEEEDTTHYILSQDALPVKRTVLRRLVKDGFIRNIEKSLRVKNGNTIPVLMSGSVMRDNDGTAHGIVCVAQDIRERKRAEEALRASQHKYRTLVEHLPQRIFLKDKNSVYLSCNDNYARDLNIAAAEIAGKTDYDLYPRGIAEQYRADDKRILESGNTEDIEEQYRVGGRDMLVHTVKTPVKNENGEVYGVLGIFWDATKERRAQQVLIETARHQAEVNRLQQDLLGPGELKDKLTKITTAAVHLVDMDFCRIWVTKAGDLCERGCIHARVTEGPHVCRYRDRCLHLLASSGRYTHTDGEGHRRVPFGCYKIGRVASGEEHRFLTNEATTDPGVHNHEWAQELGLVSFAGYQLRPPGGDTIGVLAMFSKHVITPEIDAMLESLANTAAQVIQSARAEEGQRGLQSQLLQAQRLESIGQLAAGIAHEINTPTQFVSDNTRFLGSSFPKLQGILARYRQLLDACRAGPVPPSLLDELEAVTGGTKLNYLLEQIPEAISDSLEGLERVTKIVRAMKDFAHPGQQSMSPADLNKAIESTVTVARNEWKYVAEMKLDLDPALPQVPCLLGDFNQVILNIVVNAAHAIKDVLGDAGQGKGTITISTRRDEDHVEVRISDTGSGIPEAHRGRIFDHFFTTKEVGKGTGQGLAIARQVIVEKHRGTLTFETEVGRGTTFIIRLPVAPDDKTPTEKLENELAYSTGR